MEIIQKYLEIVPRSNKPAADGKHPVLLNTMSEHLAPFVYLLFAYITSTLSWPDIWKCDFVTPVHKKGRRSDIQSYRPISILSRLSLIFEKLPFDLIYRKLRNKINYRQHGFQRGKSTGTQLIEFLDELYQNFDINEEQIVVYFDIQKASDSVSHATLLDKLPKFGFHDSLLRLIHSYLTCRTQSVRIDDTLSTVGEVSSGVPQGSVVGPLFFLLYIDDMLALPEFSHCYCFADDTKICSSVDLEKLQSDLGTISLCAYDNQMTFHKDKCCYLHFQKTKAYHLVFGHQILQEESMAVDLGVTISNDLSWNAHILTKLVNATKSLNFFATLCAPSSSFEGKTHPLPIVCCFHQFILFFFMVGKY